MTLEILHDYEEYNLYLHYPIIDYNYWKHTKEYNNDKDLCNILNNILKSLDCSRIYNDQFVIKTTFPLYSILLSDYLYYLLKLQNQILYNNYIDNLANLHITNITFQNDYIKNNNLNKNKIEYKHIKKKLPENKFVKYVTYNLFNNKETYIYENLRTGETIKSDNPDMLNELNNKIKIKKERKSNVSFNNVTFNFKLKKK